MMQFIYDVIPYVVSGMYVIFLIIFALFLVVELLHFFARRGR